MPLPRKIGMSFGRKIRIPLARPIPGRRVFNLTIGARASTAAGDVVSQFLHAILQTQPTDRVPDHGASAENS